MTSKLLQWAGEPVLSVCPIHPLSDGGARVAITRGDGTVFFENITKFDAATLIGRDTCRNVKPEPRQNSLPEDDVARNGYPMFDGLMAYFPNALAEVSQVSKIGNDQHNPGQPMHWARGKSTDHENKIMRHLVDVGNKDARGVRHSARLAWRALALLQEEIERDEGVPMSRGSRKV